MTDSQPQAIDFEHSLAELEALVNQLETGELTLENALARFERGINLVRMCQSALGDAEQRVDRLLTARDGTVQIAPLDAED